MRRRYYTDDDAAIADFVSWSVVLTGMGVAALIKALIPKPAAYTPAAPDDPTHVSSLLERAPKVDWSRAKLPKVDLGSFKPKKLGNLDDLKAAAQDLKSLKVSWEAEDRPQIVPRSEVKHAFSYPQIIDEPRAYRVYPARAPLEPTQTVHFLEAVLRGCPRLSFEIVADGKLTVWQVVDYEGRYPPQIIFDHLRTHFPGAQVEVADPNLLSPRQYPFYRHLLLFGLTNEFAAPLPFFGERKAGDHLPTLTRRMDYLDPNREERVLYQLLSLTASPEAGDRAGQRLLKGTVKPTSGIIQDKDDPLAGFDVRLLNAKLGSPLYHTFLAVTLESQDAKRLDELAQIAHDVLQVRLPQYNGITLVGSPNLKRAVEDEGAASIAWFETLLTAMVQAYQPEWRRLLSVLSPAEIATLWHVPDETYTGEKIAWAESPVPPAVVGVEGQDDRLLIGDVTQRGTKTPVFLHPRDRVFHHYITGKTGTGKSTLIENLVVQDIAAGRGVAVIDPHGQLVDHLLQNGIPKERADDVVLLECGRTDYPVPLNPFRIPKGISFATAFNYLYWVMRKIYEGIWREGRMDFVMRNVLQALLCDPEATPLDIERLFTDQAYRTKLIALIDEHDEGSIAVSRYWREFGSKSQGQRDELAQPILNRTGAFLGNRALENMTCHPTMLNFQSLIAENKIVLINLSGDAIRSEVGGLGAIFLAGFYLASERLGYLSDGGAPRFYLYVDEVERIISTPIPDMFAQARKFGLSLTLANQFLDQLPSDTLHGILGNVGTQFLFELGEQDIPTFAPYLEPEHDRRALLNIGTHRMMVKTRAQGKTLPAFVVDTRPNPTGRGTPFPRPETVTGDGFIPKTEVRAWLTRRYTPPEPPPPTPQAKPAKSNLGDYE